MTAPTTQHERFTAFVRDAEPRLRRALTALRGPVDGRDATAEALGWAWENWEAVETMDNPVGYLYRVGISRTRPRSQPRMAEVIHRPGLAFEPGLAPALAQLSERQRAAVVLVHGFAWTHQEVADALDISKSSVATHIRRAMAHLRAELGAEDDA